MQLARSQNLYEPSCELAGPETAGCVHKFVAGLRAEAPKLAEVSTAIMRQNLVNIAAGGVELCFEPMIVVARPGCGNTHFARRVADLAAVPRCIIDVGAAVLFRRT
ncbi:hypothetical protein [Thioclava sp.]|uniref:hypothetical protein n=1 Tax=Thioclava sp. TaxID=1933450 RepID=UPI003AA8A9EE